MHVFNVIRKAASISAHRMTVGQVGIITSAPNTSKQGEPLMRVALGYVNLAQPGLRIDNGFGFEAELLTTGEKVMLTIGDEASDQRILELMGKGQKINAIKERREVSNEGLKESKDYVEALERAALADGRLPAVSPLPLRAAKRWYAEDRDELGYEPTDTDVPF